MKQKLDVQDPYVVDIVSQSLAMLEKIKPKMDLKENAIYVPSVLMLILKALLLGPVEMVVSRSKAYLQSLKVSKYNGSKHCL